ncbi:hypothetical protein HPULCUR_010604 [Helicostylum pulchrum]|uniref:Uncharacterized protein n=1 Tax=Helicostylum pulchrum TaxID=562976 RepID=A0ABP9YDR0_9FUNG
MTEPENSTKQSISMVSDLDWALENAHILSIEMFVNAFGYEDMRVANNRYHDILNSKTFKKCGLVHQLLSDFRIYKGSAKEKKFWNGIKLRSKKSEVQQELELDGLENSMYFGLKAGSSLRRSSSPEDQLPFKHLKTSHQEVDEESNNPHQQEPDDNEETNKDDPKSDLSISHHDQRKGRYDLVEEGDVSEDDDTFSVEHEDPWIVDSLNVSEECRLYTDYCFSKLEPKELDDVGMLGLNYIYLFTEPLTTSVSRHFGRIELHPQITKSLDLFYNLPHPSPEVYRWCTTIASSSFTDWRDVQATTIEFLNQGLKSKNEVDLIIANVLHRMANVGLSSSHKDNKPDFGIYANGLSRRFVVLIAEFKPIDGHQTLESDKAKIGKEMKKMLNELLGIGIKDPLVCGILVMNDHLDMFKMHLSGPKLYIMTQLSSTPVTKTADNIILIPTITTRLGLAVETIKKVQTHSKDIRDGKAMVKCAVPTNWISTLYYKLQRTNAKNEKDDNEDT